MNLKKYIRLNISLFSTVLLFIAMVFTMACDQTDVGSIEHEWEDHWTVTGRVQNTDGDNQGDIEVTTMGLSEEFSATASQGSFTLTIKYPRGTETIDSVMLKYEDLVDGEYVTTYRKAYFVSDDEDTVNVADGRAGLVMLSNYGATEEAAAGAATVVTDGNASVSIPDGGVAAGAFVSLTDIGSIEEDEGGLNRFPGEFKGVLAADSSITPFRAIGLIDVTIADANGDALDLASGTNATVSIPVAGVEWETGGWVDGALPATTAEIAAALGIPETTTAWYLDETDGVWKEDASTTLTLTSVFVENRAYDFGSWGTFYADVYSFSYVGDVSHFTKWGVFDPFDPTFVEIQVIDEEAAAVDGAQVTVSGDGWEIKGFTGEDGYFLSSGMFSDLNVPAGFVPVPPGRTDILASATSGNFDSAKFPVGASDGGDPETYTTGEAGASDENPVIIDMDMGTTFVYGQVTWEADRPSAATYGLYIAFENPEGEVTYGYIDASDDDNYGNYVYPTGWDPQYLTLKPNTLYKVYVSERFAYDDGVIDNFDGFNYNEWMSGDKGEMSRFFPTYIGVSE